MAFDLTAFSRRVIDVLMMVGPLVCAAAVLFLLWLASSTRGRARMRLAHRGMQEIRGGRWRMWLAGTMLPLLAMASLNAALAIEAEIRNGPNRMLDAVLAISPEPDSGSTFWVVERGTDHFMNSSQVTLDAVDPDADGIESVAPFWAELTTVTRGDGSGQTGLVLGGPKVEGLVESPPVQQGAICEMWAGRCRLRMDEITVDKDDGYGLGERVVIREREARVVGFFASSTSLLNRSVVFSGRGHEGDPPFGLLVVASDRAAVGRAVAPGTGVEPLGVDALRRGNTDFWTGNGTPILTMLVVLIGVFGAAGIYATRRAEQEATRDVRWTVRALGLTRGEARVVDLARGLLAALLPSVPAALIGAGLVAALNAAVLGFHASVNMATFAGSTGLVLIATILALLSRRP